MAVILLSDCVVDQFNVDGYKSVKITTPATADDGDTIDLSSLYSEGCTCHVSGPTDGMLLSVDSWEDRSVTLPGATDNEVRTILAKGV